jgi:hypothetical protein
MVPIFTSEFHVSFFPAKYGLQSGTINKQGRRTDSRLYGITRCITVTIFLGGEDDHLKYYEYVS